MDSFSHKTKEMNVPKSLYLWGGTGTGKTFLMDMLYRSLPFERKLRIHFNNFMIDVHKRLHKLRSEEKKSVHYKFSFLHPLAPASKAQTNVLDRLCTELANEYIIICFDEFQVTDVADAMILKNLFTSLHLAGVVILSTSNRHPSELYKNGLQRDLFLPFIDFVLREFTVHGMDSSTDYRQQMPLQQTSVCCHLYCREFKT